jgi:hypothetical protein
MSIQYSIPPMLGGEVVVGTVSCNFASGEGSCHSSLLQTGLIEGGVQLLVYTTLSWFTLITLMLLF